MLIYLLKKKMDKLKLHIWYLMLWEFKNNKTTPKTAKKISSVYNQGVIVNHQVQNWLSKFCSGNTSLREKPRTGHSSDLDQESLRELVKYNPCKSTWELALDLNTCQSTICNHLKNMRKVSKLGIWVPHTLSKKNKEDCISIVTSLFSRQRHDLFLKNIITDDEKWVFYDNVQYRRWWIDKDESPQPIPKEEKKRRWLDPVTYPKSASSILGEGNEELSEGKLTEDNW